MSIQSINLGNIVNDGLGDDLRTAFQKVNANFSELSYIGNITAANTNNAGFGLFKEKIDINGTSTLVFKTILEGSNVIFEPLADTIKINSIDPPAFKSIVTDDENSVQASFSRDISIKGGIAPGGTQPDIEVTSLGSAITIKSLFPITETLTSYDFGLVSAPPRNIIDLLIQIANIDFGTIDTPIGLNLDFGNTLVL
jgi:hypothetical protein